MVPAQERFAPRDGLRDRIHIGLVVQHQLMVGEGGSQVLDELLTFLELLIQAGCEEAERPASFALGSVESRIGVLDQLVCRPAVARRKGDAHAAADRRHDAADDHRLVQRPQQAAALGFDGTRIPLAQQQRELIASAASHETAVPHRLPQPLGDRDQHGVPDRKAVAVVDGFEIIEVDADHREIAVGRGLERATQFLAEGRPVGEIRQRIVLGEMDHAGLGELGRRHIRHHPAKPDEPLGGIVSRPTGDAPPAGSAVDRDRQHEIAERAARRHVGRDGGQCFRVAGDLRACQQALEAVAVDGRRRCGESLAEALRRGLDPGGLVRPPQPIAGLVLVLLEQEADDVGLSLQIDALLFELRLLKDALREQRRMLPDDEKGRCGQAGEFGDQGQALAIDARGGVADDRDSALRQHVGGGAAEDRCMDEAAEDEDRDHGRQQVGEDEAVRARDDPEGNGRHGKRGQNAENRELPHGLSIEELRRTARNAERIGDARHAEER